MAKHRIDLIGIAHTLEGLGEVIPIIRKIPEGKKIGLETTRKHIQAYNECLRSQDPSLEFQLRFIERAFKKDRKELHKMAKQSNVSLQDMAEQIIDQPLPMGGFAANFFFFDVYRRLKNRKISVIPLTHGRVVNKVSSLRRKAAKASKEGKEELAERITQKSQYAENVEHEDAMLARIKSKRVDAAIFGVAHIPRMFKELKAMPNTIPRKAFVHRPAAEIRKEFKELMESHKKSELEMLRRRLKRRRK